MSVECLKLDISRDTGVKSDHLDITIFYLMGLLLRRDKSRSLAHYQWRVAPSAKRASVSISCHVL